MASRADTVTSWRPATSEPKREPDRKHIRFVDPSELKTLHPQADVGIVIRFHRAHVAEPSRGPIVVERAEDGAFIAHDVLDAVYGVGSTQAEALAEFQEMLDSHLAYLRRTFDRLDPSLRRQLALLQRLFGK